MFLCDPIGSVWTDAIFIYFIDKKRMLCLLIYFFGMQCLPILLTCNILSKLCLTKNEMQEKLTLTFKHISLEMLIFAFVLCISY